ncbi:MAG: hypothetical protein JW793_11935 [Acidobacteria bacterium]|nr:hypothetical protein [Acidobacteriota bacterium]
MNRKTKFLSIQFQQTFLPIEDKPALYTGLQPVDCMAGRQQRNGLDGRKGYDGQPVSKHP